MEMRSLVASFEDSISEEVSGCVTELAEVGLDAIMDEGLLKEVPFVSTAISIYKIGKSLKERHNIKKLAVFLDEVNKGSANEEQRKKYRLKCASNQEFRNKELEYVLVLIDRYISLDKPRMLAKLYLAYFDVDIQWGVFSKYAEIVDRILSDDLQELKKSVWNNIQLENISDSLLRLISYGFLLESPREIVVGTTLGNITIPPQNEKDYIITPFGEQFLRIVC